MSVVEWVIKILVSEFDKITNNHKQITTYLGSINQTCTLGSGFHILPWLIVVIPYFMASSVKKLEVEMSVVEKVIKILVSEFDKITDSY